MATKKGRKALKEYKRNYYLKNKKKLLTAQNKRRKSEEGKIKSRKYNEKYYKDNKKEIGKKFKSKKRAYAKKYYLKNKSKILAARKNLYLKKRGKNDKLLN